ncbi:MAG: SusC/RagA family TonB-linked outer membrane protein [bacterium]
MRCKYLLTALFCILIFAPYVVFAQEATITGTVTDEAGEPLPGANVLIQLTNLGAATDTDGKYEFVIPASSVRGQEVTMEARFIGYHSKTEKVVLAPGSITMDFALSEDVLDMDAIIVTGVVEETPRTKMAFTVGRVSQEALEQVPSISAESTLRGKVAGVKVVRASGEPGTSASVQLRAPTSIDATNRSQDPLYIIDGVIIDPSISGSPLTDINSDDIVSIEVVKGAAGASLYGSRAANGVINITTNRGRNLALNQTRIKVRNEFGINGLERKIALAKHHYFKIHEGTDSYTDANGIKVTPGDFIDADGNFIDPRQVGQRIPDRYTDDPQGSQIYFSDNPYKWIGTGDIPIDPVTKLPIIDSATGQPKGLRPLPGGQTFDHMDRYFDPGNFFQNSISVSRNMEKTNFNVTFNNYIQDGVIKGLSGFDRKSIRFSLDHKFRRDLTLSVTGYFSTTDRDDVSAGPGSPFFGLTFMGGDADLTATHTETGPTLEFPDGIPPDQQGELFIQPDQNADRDNPLYEIQKNKRKNKRERAMGSLSMSYRPFDWFKIEGNFSYDRSNREFNRFWPIGFQTIDVTSVNDGRYRKLPSFDQAMNGNITASFQRAFLNNELTVRAKARALFERTEFQNTDAQGTKLAVRGVEDLSIADKDQLIINSQIEQVRSEGYSFIAGFDFRDRYIADFLVRRDGSSLFGPDERWNGYYRLSGAYRLSQEPWWFTDKIEEFKVRASYGTAGGRPNFFARFETWSVSAGAVSKENLGNTELKPEFAKELEIGVDMAFLNRFSLEVTRAKSTVENQILFVPLASYFGYEHQWQNAGTLETSTWEISLQSSLLRRSDMSWTFGINFDRTRQRITKLDVPAYVFDPPGTQGLTVFYIKEGEEFGALYGHRYIQDKNDLLPQGVTSSELNQFQVNDDGYVVWVGDGNSYTDGISKKLWGTSSDPLSNGRSYEWGNPIRWEDETGSEFTKIGSIVPDFNFSVSSNFQWKGFSVYALLDAQIGGDIYSETGQWGFSEFTIAENDQAGKPEGLKKPTLYYSRLYSTLTPNSHFVDTGEYLKVRELSVRYSFNRSQLSGIFGGILNKLTIGVVGRNLFTFTGYHQGYDPEVGITGGDGGSAVLSRVDAFRYPNFRSFTGVLEFEF